MRSSAGLDAHFWSHLLRLCRAEIAALETDEREWLTAHLQAIAATQNTLNRLFLKAGGATACARCDGQCCDRGRHHLTLTNLLGVLLQERHPPTPDPSRPCPFLGERGCVLEAQFRPFNCVTFLCDEIEAGLSPAEQRRFYQLERRLRGHYEQIAARYPAASLRGLQIALKRTGTLSLLKSTAGREYTDDNSR